VAVLLFVAVSGSFKSLIVGQIRSTRASSSGCATTSETVERRQARTQRGPPTRPGRGSGS
jgi:hypothetical protein